MRFTAGAHPVHVSVCNLEFEETEMILAVKVFRDDLCLAIEQEFRVSINLTGDLGEQDRMLISRYLNKNLVIKLNKSEGLELKPERMEVSEDALWIFHRFAIDGKIKNLAIKNSLLVELFHDQTNLVIVNLSGKQNGYRFTYDNREENINIK
jgi:hypothetical protein